MASEPLAPPVKARLDRSGRLLAADPPIAALQAQAGAEIGDVLAVPQLAAIARLALKLGVPIERAALAASQAEDLDLRVMAEPDEEGVTLAIERWVARRPSPARWGADPACEPAAEVGADDLLTDSELRIVRFSQALARRLDLGSDALGKPLPRIFRLVEDKAGDMPLLAALAARSVFADQPALVLGQGTEVLLSGVPRNEDGRFAGYAVKVRFPGDEESPLKGLPLDDLLKEPLSAIIEEARQIAARSQGPLRNEYAGYGADISAAARHLLSLLAALNPGATPGSEPGQELDLAELVLDAAALVQPQASVRGIMLDIGGQPTLPARGQPRAVTQILVNLLGNAIRFSPDGASVTVNLDRGAQASVTVSDCGPGVSPENRIRIFERFEQGGEHGGAAGLGLAISRRLAREMGGEVELIGEGPGASFRLRLPLP